MTKKNQSMRTVKFDNEEEWLEARSGKITGTVLKDIIVHRGTTPKIGFYKLITDRIAIPPDNENRLDRGHRLEDEAIARFSKETGKKVDTSLIMWIREDNESIALSPDGSIGKTEAVEVKCLASERHLEAYLTQKIPPEYYYQAIQYFIVNDKLRKLYFVFYDPRLPVDFFYVTIARKDVQEDVEKYLAYEKKVLEDVERIAGELTF